MAEIMLELSDELKLKAKAQAHELELSVNAWLRQLIIKAVANGDTDNTPKAG